MKDSPVVTWRKNKWRPDFRKRTREFQKKFESRKTITALPGSVYATKYKGEISVPTDKHHFTPVIVSFGRFRSGSITFLRGLNLLFLRKDQQLEILEAVHKIHHLDPDARVAPLLRIHETWMRIVPYAFKDFDERRLITVEEIMNEEWGTIPLLHTHLFGTFNSSALNEDFRRESAENRKRPVSSREKQVTEEKEKPEETVSVDLETVDFEDEIENQKTWHSDI